MELVPYKGMAQLIVPHIHSDFLLRDKIWRHYRVMTEIIGVPWKSVYTLEAARIKNYGQWDLKKIECMGELNIDAFKVSDFKLAKFPVDITFNPFRLAKSFLKQFYEVGIKERLAKES